MRNVRIGVPLGRGLRLLVLTATFGSATGAHAATLAPGVLQNLSGATFEVVLDKPTADPLTYEKPLPLELIPYRERTDKFQSIGTAFAIAPNRFVSAAHVIGAANGSQYGPLALRGADGAIYRVDKIIKYSNSEDYAVFSLISPPLVHPLASRSKPPLNTPVFAVGNALGEGVVERDGLYTSDSPEEVDGRWQWLRFSAAASPGNSGGPLVDRNGKVVGVVVRKSPNENLNFALPIKQVLDGSEETADIEIRATYRIAVTKASDSVSLDRKIPLPKSLDDFFAAARQIGVDEVARLQADFMKNHADTMFPLGNSQQLLSTVYAEAFPKLISQADGGTWGLVGDAPRKVQLDNNGYLQEGTTDGVFLMRLRAPDDVSEADLVGDSKKFMDTLLKGHPLPRPVGSDSVRVTSLGKADTESWFTDAYQRKWQLRAWLVPFSDSVITTLALPTPDGMVMMLTQVPSSLREPVAQDMKIICGFVYVSYIGTLAQWQAFLSNPANLPTSLSNAKIQFDYNRGLGIQTSRFQMLVPAGVLRIGGDSVMMLKYTFLRAGTTTVWDLGGVYLSDNAQKQKWIGMLRRPKPAPSLPEETLRTWQSMTSATHPWDGVPFVAAGRTEINAMMNPKNAANGKSDIGYTMTLSSEGIQPVNRMKSDFSSLEHGFSMLE
jgi:serine protease Do